MGNDAYVGFGSESTGQQSLFVVETVPDPLPPPRPERAAQHYCRQGSSKSTPKTTQQQQQQQQQQNTRPVEARTLIQASAVPLSIFSFITACIDASSSSETRLHQLSPRRQD